MKKIKIFATLAVLVGVLASCSDVLIEHNKTKYEPGYFSTAQGVEGGLTYMYVHLRYMFGRQNMVNHQEAGTDEYTWGESAEGGHKIADMGTGDTKWSGSNNPASNLWTYAFRNINTANGVIKNGEENGVAASLLAEAYFFRAFDYFYLVQTFGGVPLDLGSGELEFNSTPSRMSTRSTVDEVYEKCIIPDLKYAVANLPDTPRVTGAVTKTTARLYLAKAYLTYAWWNENPDDIPTYPATSGRSASKASGYFQDAYNMAMEGINQAPNIYGLEDTFYDLWRGDNAYNKEAVLFSDHTSQDTYYNNAGLTGYSNANNDENCVFWMMNSNYTYMKVGKSPAAATYTKDGGWSFPGGAAAAITRAAEQGYGRPWARMAPVHGVFYNTFADTRDSRLDVSFNMVYKQNYTRYGNAGDIYGADGQKLEADAPVLKFIPNQGSGVVKYPKSEGTAVGANGFAAGAMAGENAYVIEYSHIGRTNFPGPWKNSIWLTTGSTAVGTIKTDNAPGQVNISNPAPYIIARFAEFYFVAAEANIKGAAPQAGQDARALMSVIRARAGKWNHSVAEGTGLAAKAVDYDYSAELVAAIPSTITIDWLMDEYSREFFGEARRWYDLVRTQTWIKRASSYQICDHFNNDNVEEKTFTRDISKFQYIRPIPIGQLNGLEMTDEEKAAYQNPGYEN